MYGALKTPPFYILFDVSIDTPSSHGPDLEPLKSEIIRVPMV